MLEPKAAETASSAAADAKVARFVFVGVLLIFLLIFVLADIGCRNRIGRAIKQAEDEGLGWEGT